MKHYNEINALNKIIQQNDKIIELLHKIITSSQSHHEHYFRIVGTDIHGSDVYRCHCGMDSDGARFTNVALP